MLAAWNAGFGPMEAGMQHRPVQFPGFEEAFVPTRACASCRQQVYQTTTSRRKLAVLHLAAVTGASAGCRLMLSRRGERKRCESIARRQQQSSSLDMYTRYNFAGDQQEAFDQVMGHFRSSHSEASGKKWVTLEGATGTGKTYVMARIIEQLKRPAVILSPTKVLAKQIYEEFKEFFPTSAEQKRICLYLSPYKAFIPEHLLPDGRVADAYMDYDDFAKELREDAIKSFNESGPFVVISSTAAVWPTAPLIPESHRHEVLQHLNELLEKAKLDLDFEVQQKQLDKIVRKDLDKIRETGSCGGIVNKYFALITDLLPKEYAPTNLLQLLERSCGKDGWVLMADESHIMIPSLSCVSEDSMEEERQKFVEAGARLPGPYTRPTTWNESQRHFPHRTLFVSATPRKEEQTLCEGRSVKMVVRPTFILEPEIHLVDETKQMEDLLERMRQLEVTDQILLNVKTHAEGRVMCDYMEHEGFSVERVQYRDPPEQRDRTMKRFYEGDFQVLIGVGMLGAGLSFPNVKLVVVTSAGSGGLWRQEIDLTQMAGRATRNPAAEVVFYVRRSHLEDRPDPVKNCLARRDERREAQEAYNNRRLTCEPQKATLPTAMQGRLEP
mmetsp:Transcript_18900/g.43929  ORF Transcript_18900/g.43929 Transcript_18900/m.43929 type:complete len:611 (+) Transcript_18900:83-1915(+)